MSDEMRDELHQELFRLYFWPLFGISFTTFLVIFIGGLLIRKYNKH